MATITGSYRRADRPIVYFEAKQDGERWSCVAKVSGGQFEVSTFNPSPWPCIEKLIGEALDSGSRDIEPAKFDMNRKLAKPPTKPTPLRRRGSLPPGSVPEWTPPTD
jgi:hypothetical protein